MKISRTDKTVKESVDEFREFAKEFDTPEEALEHFDEWFDNWWEENYKGMFGLSRKTETLILSAILLVSTVIFIYSLLFAGTS